MSHIFISYSHQDMAYAHKLADILQKNGFAVWIDARLDYGSQWPLEIQKQLDSCDAFILIMSPRAFSSEWVQSELSRAKRKQKQIFPLLLEGDEPWLTVESTQFIDVRGGELPPQKFYSHLETILPRQKTLGVSMPSAPIKDKPKSTKLKKELRIVGILSVLIGLLAVGLWVLPKLLLPKSTSNVNPPVVANVRESNDLLEKGGVDLRDAAYSKHFPTDIFKPGTIEYSVSLKITDDVIWSYYWCAANTKVLDSNIKAMKVQFILDGLQISGLSLANTDYQYEELNCRAFFTALSNWPAGVHHLTIKTVFTTVINDGADDYQPGEYLENYTINVKL